MTLQIIWLPVVRGQGSGVRERSALCSLPRKRTPALLGKPSSRPASGPPHADPGECVLGMKVWGVVTSPAEDNRGQQEHLTCPSVSPGLKIT